MAVLVITGTTLAPRDSSRSVKQDRDQECKTSVTKVAEAKALLIKASTIQTKVCLATADGGI